MRGFNSGFTNPVRTGGLLDVCLCMGCGDVGGVGGEWVGGWILCVGRRSRYLCIVLGGYLRI